MNTYKATELEINYSKCPIKDGDCLNCQYLNDVTSYRGILSGKINVEVECSYEEDKEEENE